MTTLLILGSSNIDHVMRVEQLPKAGETRITQDYRVQFGGKGANQAVASARLCLGATDVHFISALGKDPTAQTMCTSWKKEGLTLDALSFIDNENTGSAMIFIDNQGENCIAVNAGANACLLPHMLIKQEALFSKANHLLVQLETPIETVQQALVLAKKHQCHTILNPAPAIKLSAKLLALVDIITPNETEAYKLTGIDVIDNHSAQQAADVLHLAGIKCVIITLGSQGAYVSEQAANASEKKTGQLIPTPTVTAIDTVAAGDTFNGGLMVGLAEGLHLHQAIRFANQAAGITVTRHGAQAAIPYRHEVILE
ncbi:ribokinase [Shewanella surugensis]|uniref:Ribokinase n=1 Tax=Shewanella surugensis TaxID=212020 RepID=A0ABT0LDI4_9GAMM|nr:ribokinase [Shewanella surugensis]MCL1125744.1 ribokinase [Shewanella surugensis]